jgi:hypothetical protein
MPPPTDGREPELDEAYLQQIGVGDRVAQLHIRNTERTTNLYRKYRLKPVVLVRSLPDVMISLRDHLRRESPLFQMIYADLDHAALDDATLEAMMVRLAAPWYLNFYMGWRTAPDALMISYEELTADPEGILRRIVDFAGAAVEDRDIARAVATVRARQASRLNVGVAGRGAKLRPELLRELVSLFDFYPGAADDPYVKGVRAQVEAALAGQTPPRLGPVALQSAPAVRPDQLSPRRGEPLATAAQRYGYQVALITIGLLYWVWPNDLIPDNLWYGQVDDVVFLTFLAFLAGRVSKRTPALRELPGYLWRRLFGRRRPRTVV